ncbi:hypothetical protein ACQY0O_004598 [Thecaphora frezii]
MSTQTYSIHPTQPLSALRQQAVGRHLSELRTPALIIDRSIVRRNCHRMQRIAAEWGATLRPHLKTHKTPEASLLQLRTDAGSSAAAIVSTLAEVRGVVDHLVGAQSDYAVRDLLYGLPITPDKIAELLHLRRLARTKDDRFQLRIIVDQPDQVEAVERYLASQPSELDRNHGPLTVFVKLETGSVRAGVLPHSQRFERLVRTVLASPHVGLFGLYGHAGHSYGARSIEAAQQHLKEELRAVTVAGHVVERLRTEAGVERSGPDSRHASPLVLSVGSTPTAGAAKLESVTTMLKAMDLAPSGTYELHAGNYAFLDLQQLATRANSTSPTSAADAAMTVLATVVSEYPQRGSSAEHGIGEWSATGLAVEGDEALCDAGGIAMSKDTGPWPGYGHVVWPASKIGWRLARPSQEHGVLDVRPGGKEEWRSMWDWKGAEEHGGAEALRVGERVRILPQHACMTAANHQVYYVVEGDEGGERVVDVWRPWKGW